MFGTHDLAAFVVAGLFLNVAPGADTFYIVARSSAHGRRAGIAAALGIGAGCLIHIAAATLGVSVILAASSTAFTILKLLGAAYLLYLGTCMLLMPTKATRDSIPLPAASPWKVFWQGFLTNALNPKVAFFFLAFLPQFIAPDAHSKSLAMLFLGLIFNFNGTLWNLLLAWASARLSERLIVPPSLARGLSCAGGGIFLYFGIRLATSEIQ